MAEYKRYILDLRERIPSLVECISEERLHTPSDDQQRSGRISRIKLSADWCCAVSGDTKVCQPTCAVQDSSSEQAASRLNVTPDAVCRRV